MRMLVHHCSLPLLLALLVAVGPATAADPAQDDYGTPRVQVSQQEGTWVLRGQQNRVGVGRRPISE